MVKPTLLVLAAGMGSRYGSLKQMDGVGPNNEAIIDYSVYDAIRAGFGKVVFDIRHSFEKEFREVFSADRFGGRIARITRRRGLGRCGFLGVGFIVLCGSRSTCRQRPSQQERHYGDGCPDSPSAVCAHGVHSFSLPLPCPCIIDAIRRTTAIWTANMRNGLANPCLSAQTRISSPCGLRARAVSARRRASRRRTHADSR